MTLVYSQENASNNTLQTEGPSTPPTPLLAPLEMPPPYLFSALDLGPCPTDDGKEGAVHFKPIVLTYVASESVASESVEQCESVSKTLAQTPSETTQTGSTMKKRYLSDEHRSKALIADRAKKALNHDPKNPFVLFAQHQNDRQTLLKTLIDENRHNAPPKDIQSTDSELEGVSSDDETPYVPPSKKLKT